MKKYFKYITKDNIEWKFNCKDSNIHLFHPEIKPHLEDDIYKVYASYKITQINTQYNLNNTVLIDVPCDENGGIINVIYMIYDDLLKMKEIFDNIKTKEDFNSLTSIKYCYYHFGDGCKDYKYEIYKDIIILKIRYGYNKAEPYTIFTFDYEDFEGLYLIIKKYFEYILKHGREI